MPPHSEETLMKMITEYKEDIDSIEVERKALDKVFLPPTKEMYETYERLNKRILTSCRNEKSFHLSKYGWLVIVDGSVYSFAYSSIPDYLPQNKMFYKIHISHRQVRKDETWSSIVHCYNNIT